MRFNVFLKNFFLTFMITVPQVNVTNEDSSLHIVISQLQPGIQLLVLARFNNFPQLNTTDQGTRGWDFMQLLPISLRNIGQFDDTLSVYFAALLISRITVSCPPVCLCRTGS